MDFKSIFDARRVKERTWNQVDGIKDFTFVVKYYQRGYRWGKANIEKLLGDIHKYIDMDASSFPQLLKYVKSTSKAVDCTNLYDFYCLQALSVKKVENNQYELIDGQQRLTSVFLICELLDLFLNGQDERMNPIYTIVYSRGHSEFNLTEYIHNAIPVICDGITPRKAYKLERAENRERWFKEYKKQLKDKLKKVDAISLDKAGKSLNIDLYYMSEVAEEILDFIENYVDDAGDASNLQMYFDHIGWNTLFIWYEIPQNIEAEIEFIGLNSNKIQLTNAELIKALVLRQDEKKQMPENGGNRWEAIEQGLCQNDLWGFISGEDKATRIDLILEIYARLLGYEEDNSNINSLFDWYEKQSQKENIKQSEFAQKVLEGIEQIFYRISEWYDDVEVYHYIGLLTCFRKLRLVESKYTSQEELVKRIFDEYRENADRKDFIQSLKIMIRDCILHGVKSEDIPEKLEDIIEKGLFNYEDDKANIKAILWTLNAWETINAAENNEEKNNKKVRKANIIKRLPFSQINNSLGNKEEWTLEHIMPQTPEEDADKIGKETYENMISDFDKEDSNQSRRILSPSDIHSIGNMALLSHSVNSSIHNGNLRQKRTEITQKELGEGYYVPTSTVNAFGLYYNMLNDKYVYDYLDEKYWTLNDMANYNSRIVACLKEFN